jgi:hypothetical protein
MCIIQRSPELVSIASILPESSASDVFHVGRASVGWNPSRDPRLPCLITSRSAYVERSTLRFPGRVLLRETGRQTPEAQRGHATRPRRNAMRPEAALDLKERARFGSVLPVLPSLSGV